MPESPSPSPSPIGGEATGGRTARDNGRSKPPPSSIDLSGVPDLVEPTPPSNTLLITNLTNPSLFTPESLSTIHSYLAAASGTELASFSPLKSLRRIIISYPTTEPAIVVRQALDRTALLGCIAKVYFGAPTPVNPEKKLLKAPVQDKQFFISPPPSPPFGWTMRDEEPPNTLVHAVDLATALAGLSPSAVSPPLPTERVGMEEKMDTGQLGDDEDIKMGYARDTSGTAGTTEAFKEHRRGSSTVVYEPVAHGAYAGLPAVTVEDTTEEGLKLDDNETRIREHTARPPVELMHEK